MIVTTKFDTVLGTMSAASIDEGICLLEFYDKKKYEKETVFLSRYFSSDLEEGENLHLNMLHSQLDEYFKGTRKEFTVPVVTAGTDFQRSVWGELLNIEYGSTRSYLRQSEAMGIPGSVRAVANANGRNRISILIPCHRVIGSDKRLTGYAGGLERKKWLLEHERKFSGKAFELKLL
jgi:AraC family transcriptional regulator of adaptative response/methylated-DNA-[protein]-cysteine methyltransferase